jgi:hypothetical protein
MENTKDAFYELEYKKEELNDELKDKSKEIGEVQKQILQLIKETYPFIASTTSNRVDRNNYNNAIRRKECKTFGNDIFKYGDKVYCKNIIRFLKFAKKNSAITYHFRYQNDRYDYVDINASGRVVYVTRYFNNVSKRNILSSYEFDKLLDHERADDILDMMLSTDDANFLLAQVLLGQ